MIVDCAVYRRGQRIERSRDVAGVRADAAAAGGFAWVGLVEPSAEEFDAVRREFGLHELAVEDAIRAHQRPKLEVYGETVFLVVKTVRYDTAAEQLEIGELMAFLGPDFLVTVRHGEAGGLGNVREHLERSPALLGLGPGAALHAVVDRVVDGYAPVVLAVRDDIEEVESDVFSPGARNPVERIYKLRREVIELARSTGPLRSALEALADAEMPHVGPDLFPYFRDVADHVARINEQVDGFGTLLAGVLQANLTQVSVRQNEDMRRISAWVAILAVPTSVAGIYGMNFRTMPELDWRYGYPAVLILIGVVCAVLFVRFRRAGWL
jgi:magnesium transporter